MSLEKDWNNELRKIAGTVCELTYRSRLLANEIDHAVMILSVILKTIKSKSAKKRKKLSHQHGTALSISSLRGTLCVIWNHLHTEAESSQMLHEELTRLMSYLQELNMSEDSEN